jgi:mRNA interferase HicA
VKRTELVRHLEHHGCQLLREGGSHTMYVNRAERKVPTVPRDREVNEFLALKLCKDLGVPKPGV